MNVCNIVVVLFVRHIPQDCLFGFSKITTHIYQHPGPWTSKLPSDSIKIAYEVLSKTSSLCFVSKPLGPLYEQSIASWQARVQASVYGILFPASHMTVTSFTRPSRFLNSDVVFSKGFTVVPTRATLVAAIPHGNVTPAAPTRVISPAGGVGDAQGLIDGATSGVPGADCVLSARETSQLVDARRQNATLLSNAEIARKAL